MENQQKIKKKKLINNGLWQKNAPAKNRTVDPVDLVPLIHIFVIELEWNQPRANITNKYALFLLLLLFVCSPACLLARSDEDSLYYFRIKTTVINVCKIKQMSRAIGGSMLEDGHMSRFT